MRIGEDYGKRLNAKFNNLKPQSLQALAQTYSSHGFVIDVEEADELFARARLVNEAERVLIEKLGRTCRIPGRELVVKNLTDLFSGIVNGNEGNDDGTASEPARPSEADDAGQHEEAAP